MRWWRGAGLVLGTGLLWLGQSGSVEAVATECQVWINNRPTSSAASPDNAIPVDINGQVTIQAVTDKAPEDIRVELRFAPASVQVWENSDPPAVTSWTDTVDVAPFAVLGVGLYQLAAVVDDCAPLTAWVRVEGRSPLTTIAGVIGLGILIVGVAVVAVSLLTAFRGGHAWLGSILGGAAIGGGLLILAQQSGRIQLDGFHLATWLVVPGALGGAAQGVVSAVRGAAAPQPSPPAPAPAPPPPPPPQPAPPPPPTPDPGESITTRGIPDAESAERDPPRESYARLECPDAVTVGDVFELLVGLSQHPDAAVVGGPMRRPESSVGDYTLTVQIVADGFQLAEPGASWRLDLAVTVEAPYPVAPLRLVADAGRGPVTPRAIRAMYSVDGQPIGLAIRPIAVVANAALLGQTPAGTAQPAVDMGLPGAGQAPDLTVRIEPSDPPVPGRLLVQLLAADPSVDVPDAPIVVDIGSEPERFLRTVVTSMTAAEGQPGMYQSLLGIGYTIADQLPQPFWDTLAAVAARVTDRAPTILFLSAEPYVPWELAVVDPPLDPDLPPFLAAQATVGRWVLGQRRPRLPPPSAVAVGSMAVVSGVYGAFPGWQRLYDAEQEAAEIAQRYGATPVDASSTAVLRLVKGDPPADVLHFAVHGQYDPGGAIDGLVLTDGVTLDPLRVRGSPLTRGPFVFLNACQVGSGQAVLGDYAGIAEAFLFAGASGVIAPLWSIDDVIAREIALRFYQQALAGEAPADVLRRERAAFRDDPSVVSSTYFAYQFYGHPAMRLSRDAGGSPGPTG